MIISMLNQKGGVGKTTISTSVAHDLARRTNAESVLLVDADTQQSALKWSEARDSKLPFSVIGFCKKSLHRDLPLIASNYKYVIIDGAPRMSELLSSCIMASDFVIIPCNPSPYDVWSSAETVDIIKEVTVYKQNLKSSFVINRKIANTAIGRDVVEALKELELPVLSAQITQRIIFAETASCGKTVFDLDPEGKGATEIMSLVDEILKYGEPNE